MNRNTYAYCLVALLLLSAIAAQGAGIITGTVYVDARSGNDANSGRSPKAAWKSLEKLNATMFGPGATILLRAGSRWTGSLHPKGSGSAAAVIKLDMYGKGPKPLIDGGGLVGKGVFCLYNQEYWEISNLELVNFSPEPGDRRGVEINAADYGIVNHIYLRDLDIHHISGIVGHGDKEKRTAGIHINTLKDKIKATRFNDILVEGCHIHHIENQGIATNNDVSVSNYPGTPEWEARKLTNLVIRNNVIHHISKNAMIIRLTEGGVVENNLCYETATAITGNTIFSRTVKGTVFQYNEGFLNRSPDADGSLYDPDINSPGTIWQYSYSHDNAHGLVWFCTDKKDDSIVVRYNLSVNDKGALVYFNYPFRGAAVYNNVFYIGRHRAPVIIREKSTASHTYSFENNIIYNLGEKAAYNLAVDGKGKQERHFSHNIFFGLHPENEPGGTKLMTDPMFVNPGSIFPDVKGYEGYRLKAGSPALGAGKPVVNDGGRDFYGNKLPASGTRSIGMHEGTNITAPAGRK